VPKIPLVTAKVDLGDRGDTYALDRSFSNVTANPDMFGGREGRALTALGEEIQKSANTLTASYKDQQDKQRAETLANAVAQTNLAEPALKAQFEAPADGAGVVQNTQENQLKLIDEQAGRFFPSDPKGAAAYKTHMLGQLPHYTTAATTFEYKQRLDKSTSDLNNSLDTLYNKLRVDPGLYDATIEQGSAVIDAATGIPDHSKPLLKAGYAKTVANVRFEGMLSAAKTVDDVNRIEAELTGNGVKLPTQGLQEAGNINLSGRKVVDGKSTILSTSVNIDGKEVLIPTISPDGKKLSVDEAVKLYKDTGQHLGKFDTADNADAYARALSKKQDAAIWQDRLTDKDFEKLGGMLRTAKTTIATKATAEARTALDTLEARTKDKVEISPEELRVTSQIVNNSTDPIIAMRFGRVSRDQDLLKQGRGLPPSELRARENEAKGGAGSIYPNLPPQVSEHIAEATRLFPGVPASFLGGTAVREYGANFPARRNVGDPRFTPRPARPDVNLSNVSPTVRDAATIAGQIYGEPLTITSGYRDQTKQDSIRFSGDPNRPGVAKQSYHTAHTALDISTVGMNGQQKAKLVDSLIQSGFTGFGEYDSHIHADMRPNVPGSYDAGWGGWTRLSPDVQNVMSARGYAAGKSASQIDRSGSGANIAASAQAVPIDYGRGTNIMGADGKPTSTATGLFQFTNSSWLEMAKKPELAATIKSATGVDLSAMSDEQKLELRKDPRMSTIVAAASADANRRALESTLRRPVNDAELYMAHFLGPAGATALITQYTANGDAPAASVLPTAAAANKPVFYTKNGEALSTKQVYDNITAQFVASPSQVGYGDSKTWGSMADHSEKSLKSNPIKYAQSQGSITVTPIDSNDSRTWEARGASVNNMAGYYTLPHEDAKPFDADTEVAALTKTMKDGTTEETLPVLQGMAQMDKIAPGSMEAGMKQLGMKDSAYDVAAQLLAQETPDAGTAATIVRGQKRIDAKDPSAKSLLDEGSKAREAFGANIGGALSFMDPKAAAAIYAAAQAHYAETYKGETKFDPNAFGKSIQAVMGGTDEPRVGKVNGTPTVLPVGVTAAEMDRAVDNIGGDDLVRLSVDRSGKQSGQAPVYLSGELVPPRDIHNQGKLRYVGADTYQIQMGDGKFLVAPQNSGNGLPEPYLMRFQRKDVKELAAKAAVSPNKAYDPMTGVPY
jgi:hypothetical protein